MGQTAKQLRAQYPVKGSMPQSAVERLHALVDAEVSALSAKDVIDVNDILQLERYGKVKVANELMVKCDLNARESLMHDEHPHVRSCAVLAVEALKANAARAAADSAQVKEVSALSVAAKELLANPEVMKLSTHYVFASRSAFLQENEELKEDVLEGIRERLSYITDACDEVSDVGYRSDDGISVAFNNLDFKDGIDETFHQVGIDEMYLNELLMKESNNEINSEADIIAVFGFQDAEDELSCGM